MEWEQLKGKIVADKDGFTRIYGHRSHIHPLPTEWNYLKDYNGDAYRSIKEKSIEKQALGFYVNKKGQYAHIMSDDTRESNRTYTFTPENTSPDDDIAFMVFQEAPFENNYDSYAD